MGRYPAGSGIALIIVLLFLILLSALVVAFMTCVTTELKSSRTYQDRVRTQQLADSAVEIVIGQIADATTRGINPINGQGTEAWSTQPGLIRTYSAGGTPDSYYLLYSSDNMVRSGPSLASYDPAHDYNTQWDLSPATWTDLNEPVMTWDAASQAEIPRFPIIDPRAFSDNSLASSTPDPTAIYGNGWEFNSVEGFWYDVGSQVDGIRGPRLSGPAAAAGGTNDQRLPMPVKWVYVLQDGTLTCPSTVTTGTTADFSIYATGDPRRPTAANPIVGRMAFWTDDETSKLNVNTAAGFINNPGQLPTGYATAASYAGSYWDTPRFYTAFEYGYPNPDSAGYPTAGTPLAGGGSLALCQLVQDEFQRYPGHPATTSLGPVLNGLLSTEQLYGITPRYSNEDISTGIGGSSLGGTQRIIVDNSQANTTVTTTAQDKHQLQPKPDRLYASVDELLFGAHAGGLNCQDITQVTSGYLRMLNNNYTQPASTAITPQLLDRMRFFLTTESRAPELNLWGQPRVTIWPVRSETSTEPSGLNVFDNLMTFCSSVGANTQPPSNGRLDTTTDASTGLYRYIFTRREVGSNLDTSTPPNITAGQDCELGRNKYLLGTYLYNFLGSGQPIPGFGTNWNYKYSAQDEQSILLEMFDYIRCANSNDTTLPPTTGTAIPFAPQGLVMPSTPQTYFQNGRGPGRMPTICEATLVFYYAGPVMAPPGQQVIESYPVNNTGGWSHWDPASDGQARYVKLISVPTTQVPGFYYSTQGYMRAFLLFSTFDPMQGYTAKSDPGPGVPGPNGTTTTPMPATPKMKIQCTWQSDFSVDFGLGAGAQSLGFPTPNTPVSTVVNRAPGSFYGGRNVGGYEGFMHTLMGGNGGKEKIAWSNAGGLTVPLTSMDGALTLYPEVDNVYNGTSTSAASWQSIVRPFTSVAPSNQECYPFQTDISKTIQVPIAGNGLPAKTFKFNGGHVKVNLFYGSGTAPVQTLDLNFPSTSSSVWPVPQGGVQRPESMYSLYQGTWKPVPASPDVSTWDVTQDFINLGGTSTGDSYAQTGALTPTNQGAQGLNLWYWNANIDPSSSHRAGGGDFLQIDIQNRIDNEPGYQYNTSLQAAWSFATRLAWVTGQSDGHSQDPSYDANGNSVDWNGDRWRNIIQPGDTVRSLLFWDGHGSSGGTISGVDATKGGDLRIGQLSASVPYTSFMPHPDWNSSYSRACVLRGGDGNPYLPEGTPAVQLADTAANHNTTFEATLGNHIYLGSTGATMPVQCAFGNLPWGAHPNGTVAAGSGAVNGVLRQDGKAGDWDSGVGGFCDGPYYNKQDEGNVIYRYWDPYHELKKQFVYPVPYFSNTGSYQPPGDSFTSPSRQMPSPVMFGSLPARVPEGHHWETLCFCPNPAGANHPGNVNPQSADDPAWPKDHLLLDLFQMPTVEPYPISDPFSSAGKVNLNYRIAPFDYIRRSTALRGALHPLRVTAVSSGYQNGATNNYSTYKLGIASGTQGVNATPITTNFRLLIDRDQTIKEMDAIYNTSGCFKSASQICEVFFVPWQITGTPTMADPTSSAAVTSNQSTLLTWWASPKDGGLGNGDLTGDNCREKPYADLYPRITTKSNTYTVHLKVQALRQLPRLNGDYTKWNEGRDSIVGEYRGSATIERYLDPADPRIGPNGAPQLNPDTQSLEPLYRFRTVISRRFAP